MDCRWLIEALKCSENDSSIRCIRDTTVSPAVGEGESFISDVWRVSMVVELHSGAQLTRTFIVKIAKNSRCAKFIERVLSVYQREIFAYTKLLNNMEKIMVSHADLRGAIWPRLAGFSNNDIALEDLTAEGYVTLSRDALMDLDLTLLVVEKMARFHAMGLVLLENETVLESECFSPIYLFDEMTQGTFVDPLSDLAEVVKTSWGPEWSKVGQTLMDWASQGTKILKDHYKSEGSLFNVINHGDCRTSNFAVKKDLSGRIVDVKFLDFQLVNYSTFACDFHFFTTLSIIPEVRRKNYDKIVEHYYGNLIDTLSIYYYNIDKIPTLSVIKKELRRTSFSALLMVPPTGAYTSGIPNACNYDNQYTKPGESRKPVMSLDVFKSDKFKAWFAPDLKNFAEKGYM